MRYRKGFVLSCLTALLGMALVACSSGTGDNLMLHTVTRGAFDDILRVEGFAESVGSQAFTCPHDADGNIKYIVENGTRVKKGDTLFVIESVGIEEQYEQWVLFLENAYADLESFKANAQLEMALLEAQVRTNEAESLIAGLDSVQLLYLSPTERRIKELQMEQAIINRSRLAKKITAQETMQQADAKKIESQIAQVKRRVEKQRELMESLVVLAP